MRPGTRRRAIVAALVAAPVVLFFLVFRPVREEVEAGYQGEARANPYLAAERLFTRLGIPAETVHGNLELPPSGSTVILLGPEPLPANQDVESLLAWVAGGGRLVAVAAGVDGSDALLARFGVVGTTPDVPEARPGARASEETVEARVPDEPEPLRVAVPRGRSLVSRGEETGGEEVSAAEGTFLRRFEHGRGEVILLADDTFLRNDAIGRPDHARLAWALVHRETAGHPVAVLVVRDTVPSLMALLVRHAWPALLAGALLLLAWLWLAASRFGPVLPEPSRERRRLLEHVEAAGSFLWHQGGADALLASTRRALLARVHLREPAWEKLPRQELVRRAAEAAGLQPGPVDRALYGPVTGDAHGFVHSIQTLETVRRSL